jgi:hypothetical protein
MNTAVRSRHHMTVDEFIAWVAGNWLMATG